MKQNTTIITQNHICTSFTLLFLFCVVFSFLHWRIQILFQLSSYKMALSRADTANHRKPEQHCLAIPYFFAKRLRRLCFHTPCFYNGEIWSVEPPGCLGSACNDVSESTATAPTQGLTCSAPRWRKGQVFPLVSSILKECGIPSDSGRTPKYINLLTSRSWKEQQGLDVLAVFFKQFWLFTGQVTHNVPERKHGNAGFSSVFE